MNICFRTVPRRCFFSGPFMLFLSCFCRLLYVLCGYLLGKGGPLDSRLWCLFVKLSLSNWYPGSGVVLDCIDSWSLSPFLLWWFPLWNGSHNQQGCYVWCSYNHLLLLLFCLSVVFFVCLYVCVLMFLLILLIFFNLNSFFSYVAYRILLVCRAWVPSLISTKPGMAPWL